MMRDTGRVIVLLATILTGLVAVAAPAGAAEVCGPGSLLGVSYAVDGAPPVADLSAAGALTAGQIVSMTWEGSAEGCDDLLVTLAAHRVDLSPTAEVVGARTCALADCGGLLTFAVPDRAAVCRGALVAATGPAQLDRTGYGDAELASTHIDPGNCVGPAPFASIAVLCGRGGVGVSMTNTGELDAVFAVLLDGVEVRRVEVGSREILALFELTEDTTTTVTVVAEGDIVLERVLQADCFDSPAAPVIVADCAAGGASVVLDNPTPTPIVYGVVVDGVRSEVTVAGFSLERRAVPIDEGAGREIVVTDGNQNELARARVVRDCERPRATATIECSTSTVAFTLANDGPNDAMVELLLNGRMKVAVPVAGGERTVARLQVGNTADLVASARSAGVELFRTQLSANCRPPTPPPPPPPAPPASPAPPTRSVATPPPSAVVGGPQVLGVSFARGASPGPAGTGRLPTTGIDPLGQVRLAVALIALGAMITLGGRVRTLSGTD